MKNLITILCLCLFWFSCENSTEPEPHEVDVDWMLVKVPNMSGTYGPEGQDYETVGYYFYFISDSNITDLNLEESCIYPNEFGDCYWDEMILNTNDGILSFTYNEEEFNFDLSSSYFEFTEDEGFYNIDSELEPLQRIIYNQEMNYFTLFGQDGFFGVTLNSSSPNELIDYR